MKFIKKATSGQDKTVFQVTIGREELDLIVDMSKQFKKQLLRTVETDSTRNRLNNFIMILTTIKNGNTETSK